MKALGFRRLLLFTVPLLLVVTGWLVLGQNKVDSRILHYVIDDLQHKHGPKDLLLGSSSVEFLPHESGILCGSWLNRGIGQSQLADVIRYLRWSPLSISPSRIFIYAAENDLSFGLEVATTMKHYQQLVDTLRQRFPSSLIHIVAIKPSPARAQDWGIYSQFNHQMELWARQQEKLEFYRPEWQSPKHEVAVFREDGIHLTPYGYSLLIHGINSTCAVS
ncbi:GDSL-type esterase/lipase family protein [Pleionea sp. CnH1-48]|uniref:GDSL-type esterase/lipase family protein n=1 Tax=Pleionea sp. CnH1-48 TaxID=2954494 RepID=UPI002096AE45|nr:GDSL-type esterase/lipase family protein [Pleionea sp. CnH1-48]MCO7223483.1 hypothetical protein [Pleionea sp. CnH1-48]